MCLTNLSSQHHNDQTWNETSTNNHQPPASSKLIQISSWYVNINEENHIIQQNYENSEEFLRVQSASMIGISTMTL